jgi:hypothetical protein
MFKCNGMKDYGHEWDPSGQTFISLMNKNPVDELS